MSGSLPRGYDEDGRDKTDEVETGSGFSKKLRIIWIWSVLLIPLVVGWITMISINQLPPPEGTFDELMAHKIVGTMTPYAMGIVALGIMGMFTAIIFD